MHVCNVYDVLDRRIISPDVLPSCSAGIFRQKSFRSTSSAPSAGVAATAAGSQCARVPTPKRTGDGASTAAITRNTNGNSNAVPARAPSTSENNIFNRQSRTKSGGPAGLPSSRGPRTPGSTKHSRLGTALANKMASASSTAVVQGWPNTKDDYDLKEVIGKYQKHFTHYRRRARAFSRRTIVTRSHVEVGEKIRSRSVGGGAPRSPPH